MAFNPKAFQAKVQREKKKTKELFSKLKKQKPKALDQAFHRAHQDVFACINCLDCAHCCKTTGPLFTEKDIDRLAKRFRMKSAQFMAHYLKRDEEGHFVLQQLPCPFLGTDNYCQVYEDRPKACREYPHTDRNKIKQILKLTEKNASHCPAVFEISRQVAQGLKL